MADDAVSLMRFRNASTPDSTVSQSGVGLDLVEYRHIDTDLFELGACGNDQRHASDEGIRDHQRTRIARGLHGIDQSFP